MKEQLLKILHDSELYDWFMMEFQNEPDDWFTEKWCTYGWYFGHPNTIEYRQTNVFSDQHSDGYNWKFNDDFYSAIFVHVMLSHGFEITYNSGDNDDALFQLTLKCK